MRMAANLCFVLFGFSIAMVGVSGSPLERPGTINDLPFIDPYQPEKAPKVPITVGERSKGKIRSFRVNINIELDDPFS